MTAAIVLALYAVVVGVAAPFLLRRLRSSSISPKLGIALWLASAASMLLAALLSGVAAMLDTEPIRHFVVHLLRLCANAFHLHYAGTPLSHVAGLLAVVLLVGWCGVIGAITWWRGHAQRSRHRDLLDIVGQPDSELGAVVLEHKRAAAYCVPGSGGRIVVTSSLLRRLSPDELSAVLTHEHAHLAGRHHLLTGLLQALAIAFPFVPLSRAARTEVQLLLEQIADEVAAQRHEPDVVASALLHLADAPDAPSSTLAAGGPTVAVRALRLLQDRAPTSLATRLLCCAAVAALTLVPLALFAIPVIALSFTGHCPLPLA